MASCDELEKLSQGKWGGGGRDIQNAEIIPYMSQGRRRVTQCGEAASSPLLYFPSFLFPHRQPDTGRMHCLKEEEIKTNHSRSCPV